MLLFDFLEDEHDRISRLRDTPSSCLRYLEHYRTLPPREAAIAGYLLIAGGKRYAEQYAEGFEILCPFDFVAQNNVNNGWGQMISVNPDCFVFPEQVKLFYTRSEMCAPEGDSGAPEWIEQLAHNARCYSSDLSEIKAERIPFSFGEETPRDYWAITFRLSREAVKRRIKLAGEVFYMANIGSFILTLTDITGEYEAVFGQLVEDTPIVLERQSVDFR